MPIITAWSTPTCGISSYDAHFGAPGLRPDRRLDRARPSRARPRLRRRHAVETPDRHPRRTGLGGRDRRCEHPCRDQEWHQRDPGQPGKGPRRIRRSGLRPCRPLAHAANRPPYRRHPARNAARRPRSGDFLPELRLLEKPALRPRRPHAGFRGSALPVVRLAQRSLLHAARFRGAMRADGADHPRAQRPRRAGQSGGEGCQLPRQSGRLSLDPRPLMPAWLAALLTRKMLICIFTGFSSGLPLYLLLNLLPAWLRSEGVDLKTIGFFALIQFPYTWKFLWSPLLDRFSVPGFGRRRGWMLLTQIGLLFTIGSLGGLNPQHNIWPILWLATLLALLSGTQDIAVDAFRREILTDQELGLGNAVHVNAYRIAGLIPGSLSLILADRLPWNEVFWITSAFMLPGMAMAWLVSEPLVKGAPKTLRQAVTEPFHEFVGRQGWRGAAMVLGFIFLYKLGDSLCTALATPFYLDMGFTKTDIGLIAKHAGLWPAVIGALLGGLWMVRLGINRALWLFGVVQLVSILGFAWLAWLGPQALIGIEQRVALAAVIGLEALGV